MGYDIWLEIDCGGEELAQVSQYPGNMTYNVDPMFTLALDGDIGLTKASEILLGKEPALKRFIGRTASACIDDLNRAIANMKADPNKFRALNPKNGWGNYEGALEYLCDFLKACERYPKAKVGAWL